MSTGSEELFDQFSLRRGLYGGAGEPMQRLDFNFAEAGMGGAFSHPLAPMVLQPVINALFGHGGIMPAQFAPQQGFYDQWRSKQYWQARQAAMTTASQADRETYVHMLRGMAQMSGTPWGLSQQRSANVMAGDVAFMAPFLAQAMPETFDALHGTRGSATVMASFLHKGGLTGVDPVTGRTGISGESAGVLAAEMHRRFFGVDADLAGWRGLSAGRAGALYDELQNRGVMGMSVGAMSPAERTQALLGSMTSRQDMFRLIQAQDQDKFKRITTAAGTTDIDRLAGMEGVVTNTLTDLQKNDQTKFDALVRQLDASKIGNRLKEMSGAVAAMREIFGDAGRPNAPMSELIEGLNSLTQGGLATMNPAELERSVRTTQVIARTSGMGMQALAGLTAQSANTAMRMGLDPRFGLLAAQGAAEFGAAYGQVGRGDVAGWGRADREKVTLLDDQLRLHAAASPMANQLGAAMRIFETQQANGGARGPLAALAKAIQSGASEFEIAPGQMHSLNMTEAEWRGVMERSNVSAANAMAHLRSPGASQEMIAKYGNIGNIVRGEQVNEIRGMIGRQFHEAAMSQLETVGVTGGKATQIAEVAAAAQARAMTDMPVDVRMNEKARNNYLRDATRTAVMATGVSAAEFDRMFPQAQFAMTVSGAISRTEEEFRSNPRWAQYGHLNTALDVHNPEVRRRKEFRDRETAAEVALGTNLAGLGTAGFLARMMDEIQDPSLTAGDAVKRVLGGVDPAEVRMRLANMDPSVTSKEQMSVIMEELLKTTREYEAVQKDVKLTPEERITKSERILSTMRSLRQGGGEATAKIRELLLANNLVGAKDDDATVRKVAQSIMKGDIAAPEDVKNLIGGLVASGGAADAAAIRQQQIERLKTAGITDPKDIEQALAGGLIGDARMTADVREDIEKLGATGLDAIAAGANVHLGAKIGVKDLSALANQQSLLAKDMAKGLPAAGPERARALAERSRHAKAITERGERIIDAMLGDTAAMKNLGEGGFDLVKGAHENIQEQAKIASDVGLNVTDILSGAAKLDTPEKRAAAAKVLGLQTDINSATDSMIARMKEDPDKRKAMTPAELKRLGEYQDKEKQTDAEKNKNLAADIVKGVGREEDRAAIVKQLGEGPGSEARRASLKKRADAAQELKLMAAISGISVKQLREEAEGGGVARFFGGGSISSEDAAKASELIKTAGALGEDDSITSVLETIGQDETERKAAKAEATSKDAATGGGGMVKCSGEVTVNMETGKMNMNGMQMNSTPQVTG
jgi:hypothetical protein